MEEHSSGGPERAAVEAQDGAPPSESDDRAVRHHGPVTDASAIASLYAAAPVGLGVLDLELRWTEVNDAAAALQNQPREAILGRRPSEINADIGARAEACARAALETGGTVRRSIGGMGADGERWFDFAAFPIDGGVGVVAVEITARMEAERLLGDAQRHDALLVRAGQVLSSALTIEETTEHVAHLFVPEIADWCVVELDGDGGLAPAASAHYAGLAAPPDGAASHTVALVARGREIGRLVFGTDASTGRTLGQQELDSARALADRAAISLDNANIYLQRDRIALSLQEELLPPRLPEIPGLEIAAWYSAAGEGNEVGGDFYDLFPSDDGWQVVIGDVLGKGPRAAAITGLARHTMRAAGAYEGAPSQLLRVLNGALLAERAGSRLASVACVRVDPSPDGVALTASAAGHPLPLIVGCGGEVRELGRFGQLLGVEPDLVVFNTPGTLAPGELLVLYTDGVTETRGPGGTFGEDQLRALLASLAGEAPALVLERVEAALHAAAGDQHRDDVAMVALRRRPEAVPAATRG
jgi:serine phosphatase RsbU (regulator of sigma subunit)/PAS domain-containing protein